MYEYIKGQLTKIASNYIVVEAAGLGYMVHVANPYRYSDYVGSEVTVYLHQVVREDAHVLYGFYTEEEKSVFLNLISVKGIGPMSALAVIAADDNEGLVNAIDNGDIKYLMKFPKIGKKTAQQMALDLTGKFVSVSDMAAAKTPKKQTNVELDEAMEAMQALGYKASELKKIRSFFEGTNETAEYYIKNALKML